MKNSLIFLCILLFPLSTVAQDFEIMSLKEQAEVRDAWLKERFKQVIPPLMRREGIDMWLLLAREYNEDPVMKTMLPATWLSARRTTMLVIFDNGREIETFSVARYDVGEIFKKAWDPEQQPDQWKRLTEIILEKNPRKIALNKSPHFGHADGLSAYHFDKLMEYLPPAFKSKIVSGEKLSVGWLEKRIPEEMAAYRKVMRLAHEIIAQGLSEEVITPGVTKTEDVVWWYREKISSLGLSAWFHPTVDVQRGDDHAHEAQRAFSRRPDNSIIQPGDLVHIDFGISYLGLHTDTQENAYVCRIGEHDAPPYLKNAFQQGLTLMDFLTDAFKEGKSGNEVLGEALAKAVAAGLKPSIYSHPIGFHGHGAGPTIGLWDQQGGVPHTGDYQITANTAYSIELNTRVFIPEWNKEIRMMMEEDAFFDGKTVSYIDGRQVNYFLIPRPKSSWK
jgi:Xaa-Pro aminopeptidase